MSLIIKLSDSWPRCSEVLSNTKQRKSWRTTHLTADRPFQKTPNYQFGPSRQNPSSQRLPIPWPQCSNSLAQPLGLTRACRTTDRASPGPARAWQASLQTGPDWAAVHSRRHTRATCSPSLAAPDLEPRVAGCRSTREPADMNRPLCWAGGRGQRRPGRDLTGKTCDVTAAGTWECRLEKRKKLNIQ